MSQRQISRRSVEPLLRFGDFSIFHDGGRAILDFKSGKCSGGKGPRRPKRVTMPNFAQISQTVAVIWPFFDFSTFRFFKVAEAAILDF